LLLFKLSITIPHRNAHILALVLLVFWNTLLVWHRQEVTGKVSFVFFLWNLILAITPYLSSEAAVWFSNRKQTLLPAGFALLAL